METWRTAKNKVHDASGIECPESYIWETTVANSNVLYPSIPFKTYKGNGYIGIEVGIEEGEVIIETHEHGGEKYDSVTDIEWYGPEPIFEDIIVEAINEEFTMFVTDAKE
jgi:hypothetical protein